MALPAQILGRQTNVGAPTSRSHLLTTRTQRPTVYHKMFSFISMRMTRVLMPMSVLLYLRYTSSLRRIKLWLRIVISVQLQAVETP